MAKTKKVAIDLSVNTEELQQQESAIKNLVNSQRDFFSSGTTIDPKWRISQLKKLYTMVQSHEKEIYEALRADLNKPDFDAYCTEIGIILKEIGCQMRHVKRWSRRRSTFCGMTSFPATGRIQPEPYGTTLIMSPWNYPFMLTLTPLVDAIAAGNTAVLKTSEYSPASSRLLKELISAEFPPEFITIVEGGYMQNQILLQQHFDFIFFTGSPAVGKIVMENAARNLTPVCLELGGKSPCIVDSTAKIQLAAKRIIWGKLLNAGQTCVAPDYVLVHQSLKEDFIKELHLQTEKQYGKNPLEHPEYAKIINKKHFNRLLSIAPQAQLDTSTNKIAPTIVDLGSFDSENASNHPLMKEEIFGPILPVISFNELEEAISFVKQRPIPLALYLFSTDKATHRRIMETVRFGGGCINDVVMHLATNRLPFGGMGNSGIGQYHGKFGFDTFSHIKGILVQSPSVDLNIRYSPHKKKLGIVKIFQR